MYFYTILVLCLHRIQCKFTLFWCLHSCKIYTDFGVGPTLPNLQCSLTYQSRLRRRLLLFVDAFACFNVCLGLVSCLGRCPLVAFLSLQAWSLACLRVHAPFIVGPPCATLNRFPAACPRG